jgi:hypothetical protein
MGVHVSRYCKKNNPPALFYRCIGIQFVVFPGPQVKDHLLNFSDWSQLLLTRQFPKEVLDNAVSQRHLSKALTYPYTIASLLYTPGTYSEARGQKRVKGNPVTDSGWHVFSGTYEEELCS